MKKLLMTAALLLATAASAQDLGPVDAEWNVYDNFRGTLANRTVNIGPRSNKVYVRTKGERTEQLHVYTNEGRDTILIDMQTDWRVQGNKYLAHVFGDPREQPNRQEPDYYRLENPAHMTGFASGRLHDFNPAEGDRLFLAGTEIFLSINPCRQAESSWGSSEDPCTNSIRAAKPLPGNVKLHRYMLDTWLTIYGPHGVTAIAIGPSPYWTLENNNMRNHFIEGSKHGYDIFGRWP